MMARVKLESHASHAVRARWAVPVGASGRDALVRHLVYAFIRSDPEGATDWIDSTVPTDPDELRTMLDFAARKHIAPQVEVFPLSAVNEALRHVRQGRARYRVVLKNDFDPA